MYREENAINLNQLGFITRIPGTIKEEQPSITSAMYQRNFISDFEAYSGSDQIAIYIGLE